ncbi:MAG TPA: rhodanese-like domain-containing protein, partial [Acidimicrobiales bacterium]
SAATSSTVGEQRRTNYALQTMDEDAFVAVTESQPPRPAYFDFDAETNRRLHPLLDPSPPTLLGIDEVLALAGGGAVLLDAREPADYAAGHLCGAVAIGLHGRFAEWAGLVLSPERDIVLVGDPASALEARVRLGRIGYDRVVGQLDEPGVVLVTRPELHETSSRLTIAQLAELQGLEPGLQLVDVRSPAETAGGTIAGAQEIPLPALTDSLSGLDRDRPVVVYCAGGTRSQVAASVMRQAGFTDVSDLLGGFAAWEAAGLPSRQGRRVDDGSWPARCASRPSTSKTPPQNI